MSNLSVSIEQHGYVVSEQQVESLAAAVHEGTQLTVTYLRALVVAVQAALGRGKRAPAPDAQVAAVDSAHEQFYAWALAGLRKAAGGALPAAELNRRGTFARVAASAMRTYAKGGGDVRKLVAAVVKRRDLRPDRAVDIPAGASREERAVIRATAVIARTADRLIDHEQIETARALIEDAIMVLQARLTAMSPQPELTQTVVRRARASAPRVPAQLHRSAA